MHRLITISLLFFGVLLQATPYSKRIDTSSSNIPTSFSSASTSKLANLTGLTSPKIIYIDNRSGTEVAVNCSSATGTVPSDTSANNIYVDTLTKVVLDNPGTKADCYIRSMGSAISSGIVVVTVVAQ